MSLSLEYLRSFKVGGMAAFDWIASFIGMYFVAYIFGGSVLKAMVSVLPLSIIFHVLVDEDTKLTRMFYESMFVQVLFVASLYYILFR